MEGSVGGAMRSVGSASRGSGRRGLLRLAAGASLAAMAPAEAMLPLPPGGAAETDDWQEFRRRFITHDGRVVDNGTGGATHSEGQGAAMLFAVRFDDRATFDRLLRFSRDVLRRPDDALLAWRYQPMAAVPVADLNNATDGDLMGAWALAEAATRWGVGEYRRLAAQVARDVLRRLVLPLADGPLLLPGVEGFLKPDHVVVNPGYAMPLAFRALAPLAPSPAWGQLEAMGQQLIDRGRFGRWRLPADWLAISRADGRPSLAPGPAPRFSYDAIRVPLHQAWSGSVAAPALMAAAEFWAEPEHGIAPAWVDLRGNLTAPYRGDAGVQAVARLTLAAVMGRASSLPRVSEAALYYPASLALQCRLAWQDIGPRIAAVPAAPTIA
jgi:endoglucanase